MARLDARWENFSRRGQAWDHFWQDAAAAGAATVTVAGAMAQAAASPSGTLAETFTASGTLAQPAAVLGGNLAEAFVLDGFGALLVSDSHSTPIVAADFLRTEGDEDFLLSDAEPERGAGGMAQPAAVLGGTARTGSLAVGALTQDAATQAGALAQAFTLQGAVSQPAATIAGTSRAGSVLSGATAQSEAVIGAALVESFSATGAMSQATAGIAAAAVAGAVVSGALAQDHPGLSGAVVIEGEVTAHTLSGELAQAAATMSGSLLRTAQPQPTGWYVESRPFVRPKPAQMRGAISQPPLAVQGALMVKSSTSIRGSLAAAAPVISGRMGYNDDDLVLILAA